VLPKASAGIAHGSFAKHRANLRGSPFVEAFPDSSAVYHANQHKSPFGLIAVSPVRVNVSLESAAELLLP
jgi:hypothetical protein